MKLIAIAAVGERNELGKDNQLLWHLPDDFKRFKALTSQHFIIMGRKTFESFPKPLPHRTHIVITRQDNYPIKDCIVVKSIDEAIKIAKKQDKVFVIGGGEIYKQFMPYVDEIELTRVRGQFDADTYFPEINLNTWTLTQSKHHPKDDKHNYAFDYETYTRKSVS
ncbi:dihydrofolate reductase [Psychroflexus sp. MBR-150]